MLNDNFDFDVGDSTCEDASFKSCFARSVVVNSQNSGKNVLKERQESRHQKIHSPCFEERKGLVFSSTSNLPKHNGSTNLKKENYQSLENVLHNNGNDVVHTTNPSRIVEVPVENVFSKSQIETLEWQLKQTEASREMYRAVMLQVVKFLEKAHHSLRLLGSKLNSSSLTIPRNKHDFNRWSQALPDFSSLNPTTGFESYNYSDTWKRSKKPQPPLEDILPEKLSQEAFMLLRTAESLLNTREPDLTHANADKDLKFLTQLAKEFPSSEDYSSQYGDCSRISTVSLEQSRFDNNRVVLELENQTRQNFNSLSNSPQPLLSSTFRKTDSIRSYNSIKSTYSNKLISYNINLREKSSEAFPTSNASSAEDESGFSSITSFQDLGIPVTYSILSEKSDATIENNNLENFKPLNESDNKQCVNDFKLWNKSLDTTNRCVTPTLDTKALKKTIIQEEKPLKVLWV